jgi:murein DD-endopeptidase MepM/ murein hydrolase activator NlpD
MVHQRSATKRKKFFTFVVIPHSSAQRIFRWQMPEWLANILFTFLIIVASLIILSLLYSTRLTAKLIHYYGLLAENHRQAGQIEYFLKETDRLKQDIDKLEEKDQQLREMLGLPRREALKKSLPVDNNTRSEVQIQNRFALLQKQLLADQAKQYELQASVEQIVAHIATLPTDWPVTKAPIRSGFGWRMHPILGRPEFHAGVDIPTWYGAPIRATAGGKVTYAGFAKGYGYMVMVDHGNGLQTIFGHNSQLYVEQDNTVIKGQILARAGCSGWSTGVHCHYEIRRDNASVSPIPYLNMDIRTAARW